MYHVLYIDDEADLLEVTKFYLEISHEFIIDTDTSALETLTHRDLSMYDAIISDYQMPEMDGITFLKKVRAKYGSIPFILFTGRGREEVVIQALNSGADFYLQKGGDPRSLFAELMHKIRIVVQRRQTEDALRTNDERLRMAQAIGKTGNWEYNLKTKTLWASEEGLRIFGIHRQSGTVAIEEIEACIPNRERVQKALQDLIIDEKRYDLEYSINPADGAPQRIIHSVAQLIRTGERKPIKVAGAIHDITERKEAERVLQESENLYRTIFENTGAATIIIRNDMIIEHTNRRFVDLSGFSKEEIEGKKSWIEFVARNDLEWMKNNQDLWQTEPQTPRLDHFRFINRNGCIKMCIINLQMIAGTMKSVASIIDITELKRTEDELRENRRTLVTLMNNLQGMAYRCANDSEWTMEFVSRGSETLTGYDPDDLITNRTISYGSLILPEDQERVWKQVQTCIDKKQSFLAEYRIRDRYNQIKWVWEQGQGVFNNEGDLLALEGYIMDITRRREAEDELNRINGRNKALLLANPDRMFVFSADGRIVDYHAGDASALYVPQDQFLGKDIRDVLPPDVAQVTLDNITLVAETSHPQRYEYCLNLRDETHFFESRLVPSGDHEFLSIVRDISEDRLSRMALTHNEETLSRRTKALEILNTIINTTNQATNRQQVLGDILNETLRLLDFDAGGIYLVDQAAGIARVVHSKNLSPEFLAKVREIPLDGIPYRKLFIEGIPIITDHYEEVSPDHAIPYGFQSVVSVPLHSKARIIGALNVVSTRRHMISPEERETLISIGQELGGTIERMTVEKKNDEPTEKHHLSRSG
jgi:PAS domain S-box-containing protein